MTNQEIFYIINALKEIVDNIDDWQNDYDYDIHKNEFFHKSYNGNLDEQIKGWFNLSCGEKVTN